MSRSVAGMVGEFHAALGQRYGGGSIADSALRIRLHTEENAELVESLRDGDLVNTARELADVVYVAYGTAYSLGFDLDAVLVEIHRAAMSKVDRPGGPILDADGKVLKPPGFVPPAVARVIAESPCPCCRGDRATVCDACGEHACWVGTRRTPPGPGDLVATYSRREVTIRRVEFDVPSDSPWGACWPEVCKAAAAAIAELRAAGRLGPDEAPADDLIRVFPRDDSVVVAYELRTPAPRTAVWQ